MPQFQSTPVERDNLLLRIRAEDLLANLTRTSERLAKLPNLHDDLETLSGYLVELRERFFDIRRNVIEKWITDSLEEGIDPTDDAINEARNKMTDLLTKIRAALKEVDKIKQLSYLVQDKAIAAEISNEFNALIFKPRKDLEIIKDAIVQADMPPDLWTNFTENALQPSCAIFSECVEVLGGIALRDSRVDQDICAMAEELISAYPAGTTRTRAMPAVSAAVEITLARIVRLIYPQWTVWSLPLVAHEFWHAAACKDFDMYFRDVRGAMDARFEDCLADSFATFTLGPAFAYAGIVLLLDPNRPYEDKGGMVCDEIRAEAMLGMLRMMDTTIGLDPFTTIAEYLQGAWNAAKAQTGAQPTDDQRKKLDKELPLARKLVSGAWQALSETHCVSLAPEIWKDIEEWRDCLLDGRKIELKADASLSQAINAAWAARVAPRRDPDIDLSVRVQTLVDEILGGLRKSREQPTQRGGRH